MRGRVEWEELAALDETLLGGHPDLAEADRLVDRRMELVRKLSAQAESATDLAELEASNRRLMDWLHHCRRVALIESAAIEQHLRFLLAASGQPEHRANLEVLG